MGITVILMAVGLSVSPGAASDRSAGPVVFWTGDPVRPGETVLIVGHGFGDKPAVDVVRLGDGPPGVPSDRAPAWPAGAHQVDAIQATNGSVKFVVPDTLKPGVFACRITGAGRQEPPVSHRGQILVNCPNVWWVQGDVGVTASPGGWVRAFGKNLGQGHQPVGPDRSSTTVLLTGPRALRLKARADGYSAKVALPGDLPPGDYRVRVHNGWGGNVAWSRPVTITVTKRPVWPAAVFNVKKLGAVGDGIADDTQAVQGALSKARAAGGGVVYFPRGRYQLGETLHVPTRTVLRGERRDLTQLFWGDGRDQWRSTPTNRLACVIKGTHDFGVEDMMLWFVAANNGLVADQKGPDAGNVFVRRVRMQWLLYGGYLTIAQAGDVFKQTATDGGAGAKGMLLRLGGTNVEVTDCDMESSGSVFWLVHGRGARIANNRFRIGRLGYAFVRGCERVIIENNAFEGADNMARSAVFFSSNIAAPATSRVYFAHNRLSDIWGWDRECMSTDGASGQYFGPVARGTDTVVTLPEAQRWGPNTLAGHTLTIVGGRGKGQYRRVTGNTDTTLTVAPPFDVCPDATTIIGVNHTMDRFLVVGNDYRDVRIAFQFYGTGMESIVAHNTAARSGGFWSHASHYAGPPAKGAQPQLYIQYLRNHITEGHYAHAVPSGYQYGGGDSVIGVGARGSTNPDGTPWRWPMAIGFVIRGNRLDSNGRVRVAAAPGAAAPLLEDAVVEGNHVARSRWGIDVSAGCARVLVRRNTFDQVERPLTGDGIGATGLHPAELLDARLATLDSLVRQRFDGSPPERQDILVEVDRLKRRPAEDAALPGACRQAYVRAVQAVARWQPTGHSVALVEFLSGLTLTDHGWQRSTLHRLLHDGRGGTGQWPLVATVAGDRSPVRVTVTPVWPTGWRGDKPTVTVQVRPGEQTTVPLSATVPAGTWGPYAVPLRLRVSGSDLAPIECERVLTVGAGVVLDFAHIGPFPNRSGAVMDRDAHPPEYRLDLKAGVPGAAGKVRWQFLRARGVDLAALYKPTGAATGYVLACVRATEPVGALVQLCCDGALAVWLNGSPVLGFRGRSGEAKVTLKAGDNVLLIKVCSTAAGLWRMQYLNVNELGPRVGGRIRVVPVAELPNVPVLNPPPAGPAKPGGPLKHAQGVAWHRVHAEAFDGGRLGTHWRVASGTWRMRGGVLHGEGRGGFLSFARRLRPPVRIEYDARSKQPGDLSAFYLDDPADYTSGHLLGFASNDNTLNKFMVDGDRVAESAKPLAVPRKWHHVIAQILPNGRLQLFVDGRLALQHRGTPLPPKPKFVGLWTWSAGEFDNVRIFTGAPAR